ncbi:MAG: hypothetical protein Kow0059_10700 [Candidatus Sumerlaeia bacterium]
MTSDRRSICFYAKAPNNVVMWRPLWEVLRRDDRLAITLCGEWQGSRRPRALFEAFGMPSDHVAWLPLVRWRDFDMLISPDVTLAAPRARWRVQIYHGVSFKGRPYRPLIRKFNKLFLIGEDMRRRYVQRGILPDDDDRFERIGMPKTDPLITGPFDRDQLMARHGLDPTCPTVLYAPTWRKESSIYTFGREFLSYLRHSEFNVLVKLHDWLLDPRRNPIDWRTEIILMRRPGFVLIEDPDIIPWLRIADLLVSDASSVANEYLLLNRPIVFLDVPQLFEKYKETIDLDGWGRKTGTVVGNVRDAVKAVKSGLAGEDGLSEVRRAAAADYFYNPGRATAAAIARIYSLLDLDPPSDVSTLVNHRHRHSTLNSSG